MKNRQFNLVVSRLVWISTFLIYPLCVQAHLSFQDTGDLLREDQLQFSTEIQFQTTGDTGINAIGRLDKGFDRDTNFRFMAGAGTTDYQLGGYVKWVPFPDFDLQPAIGFSMGSEFARYDNESELAIRIIPFASKKFESYSGDYIPYIALPLAYANYGGKDLAPIQLVFGSRYENSGFEYCDFNLELGLDLNDSFTYFSVGAIFPAFEY